MKAPKLCPVCGHDSIKPVRRSTLVKLDNENIPEVLAYRCGQGHLFLVAVSEDKRKSRENPEGPNSPKKR